ncbi:rod shape-determining protein MreD [Calditerricola satsumensis]|uniref:Rod shape-determining protein MreD n=1 Tax=Calditerricola satsumensis TaxID=373054 RepID=A0A8J3BFM1_9BACI|nr:rod shape-determining protein MreD [Calditerricola satsumensis]GGK03924.1 hypothetical protein GCM10007043_17520 [Calditerricola satsumensis]
MNARAALLGLLFLLVLVESTWLPPFSPQHFGSPFLMAFRFSFVVVLLVAMIRGRRVGFWLGLALGFLHDVLYSGVIGVYAFGMGLTAYLAGYAFLFFHRNLLVVGVVLLGALVACELIVFGFYRLFLWTAAPLQTFWLYYLIPTVAVNALFGLLVYRPLLGLIGRDTDDGAGT